MPLEKVKSELQRQTDRQTDRQLLKYVKPTEERQSRREIDDDDVEEILFQGYHNKES